MELGLAFDDEDLQEHSNQSKTTKLISYNAKFCPRLWYEGADTSDDDTAAQILKYRGDNSYLRKEYAAAIHHYEESLGRLPANNKGMRREMMESQARCHVGLGQHEQAMQLAHQLKDDATSPDQHMQTTILLAHVHEAAHNWPDMEAIVKLLICSHADNADLWLSLARCYWHQCRYHTRTSRGYCRLVTCLARARLLYTDTRRSVEQFVWEKHQACLKQIDQQLSEIGVGEDLLQRASQFVSQDVYKVDQQEGEDKCVQKQLEVTDFDKRWFSWVDDVSPT